MCEYCEKVVIIVGYGKYLFEFIDDIFVILGEICVVYDGYEVSKVII